MSFTHLAVKPRVPPFEGKPSSWDNIGVSGETPRRRQAFILIIPLDGTNGDKGTLTEQGNVDLGHRFSNQEQSLIERDREVWGVWEVWGESR